MPLCKSCSVRDMNGLNIFIMGVRIQELIEDEKIFFGNLALSDKSHS